MLKNRAFQVKMVKDHDALDVECNRAHYDAAEINTIVTHQVNQVARAVVAVVVLTTVTKTCSAVLIHAAQTYIK